MDNFHPMADGIAKEAMLRIFKNLPIAFKDGSNVAARGEMLMASAMGATAFQKGLGVNHAIAHAMGVLHDTHHGLANAVVLIEVMKYNMSLDSVRDKLANLGAMLGTKKEASAFIDLLSGWLADLNMPAKISDLSMNADHIQALEDYALGDPCCPLNPRKVEKGDVVEILSKLI